MRRPTRNATTQAVYLAPDQRFTRLSMVGPGGLEHIGEEEHQTVIPGECLKLAVDVRSLVGVCPSGADRIIAPQSYRVRFMLRV
jgi:hypothetical protein